MAPQTFSGQPWCHPETSTEYMSSLQSEGKFLQGENWELSLVKPCTDRVQQGAEPSCNAMTASVDSYAAAMNHNTQIRASCPEVDTTQGALSILVL